jgi:hypothetical protein
VRMHAGRASPRGIARPACVFPGQGTLGGGGPRVGPSSAGLAGFGAALSRSDGSGFGGGNVGPVAGEYFGTTGGMTIAGAGDRG